MRAGWLACNGQVWYRPGEHKRIETQRQSVTSQALGYAARDDCFQENLISIDPSTKEFISRSPPSRKHLPVP